MGEQTKVDVLATLNEQMALAEQHARDSLKRYGRVGTSPAYWVPGTGEKFACRIRVSRKGRETVMWLDGEPDAYWGGERIAKAKLIERVKAAAAAKAVQP